jgi:hypothetical protein
LKKIIFAALILTIHCTAQAEEAKLGITTGVDYSSGKYGQSETTHIKYVPFIFKYELDKWLFKATVPWLVIDGPGGATGGDSRIILTNDAKKRSSESGLGDVVTSLTYSALESRENNFILDLGAKVKWGTASFKKSLGSGENDYSIQVDAYKTLTQLTFFSTIGYKKLGDPDGIDLNNVWFSTIGAAYKFNRSNSAGILLDLRQASTNQSTNIREYTAYYSHKFNPGYNLQTYIGIGDTTSSVDFNAGMMLGISW